MNRPFWRLVYQWADTGQWDSETGKYGAEVSQLLEAGSELYTKARTCELWHTTGGLMVGSDEWPAHWNPNTLTIVKSRNA